MSYDTLESISNNRINNKQIHNENRNNYCCCPRLMQFLESIWSLLRKLWPFSTTSGPSKTFETTSTENQQTTTNVTSVVQRILPPPTFITTTRQLQQPAQPTVQNSPPIEQHPPTLLPRRYPPPSLLAGDVCTWENDSGAGLSPLVAKEAQNNLFADAEILEVHQVMRTEKDKSGSYLEISFSKNGKAIIQQQAAKGCSAGATAMLIYDKGKAISVQDMLKRSLAGTDSMVADIEKAGLQAKVTKDLSFDALSASIEKDGSAILYIEGKEGEIKGHFIVLDELTMTQARIRDPYHGWEITVTRQALEERYVSPGTVIQIASLLF